jgi:hypothetical protein
MKSRFDKHDELEVWGLYFHAGSAWANTARFLRDSHSNPDLDPLALFYVLPFAMSHAIELFIKSIASFADSDFVGIDSHKPIGVMQRFAHLPIFARVLADNDLVDLVNEYSKTLNAKFGEMAMYLDGDERDRLFLLIDDLRSDLCAKTGLR